MKLVSLSSILALGLVAGITEAGTLLHKITTKQEGPVTCTSGSLYASSFTGATQRSVSNSAELISALNTLNGATVITLTRPDNYVLNDANLQTPNVCIQTGTVSGAYAITAAAGYRHFYKQGSVLQVIGPITLQGSGSPANLTGGVSLLSNSKAAFYGVTFQSCKDPNAGGIVIIAETATAFFGDRCAFTSSRAPYGGAIFAKDFAAITMGSDTAFKNNAADYGGVFSLSDSVKLAIGRGPIFSGNSASVRGGVINAAGPVQIFIGDGATFSSNSAIDGGAISMAAGHLNIGSGSYFTGNSATTGGSFKVGEGAFVLVGDRAIIQDSVADNGAAVYAYSDAEIDFGSLATFKGNNASASKAMGGAFSLIDNIRLVLGPGALLTGNKAFTGGAIFAAKQVTISIGSRSILDGNVAAFGGALSLTDSADLVIGSGTVLKNNSAQGEGGAGGAINAVGGATIEVGDDVEFVANKAAQGGALALEERVLLHMGRGGTFASNSADFWGASINARTDVAIRIGSGATFSENKAKSGGAIEASSGVTIDVGCGATFVKNSATEFFGGAIEINNQTQLTLGDFVTFDSNTAAVGGALEVQDFSDLMVGNNAVFTGNKASFLAGAIDTTNGLIGSGVTVQIGSNAVFSDNSAEGVSVLYLAPGAYAAFGPNPSFLGNTNSDNSYPALYLDADNSVGVNFYSNLVMGGHAYFQNPGNVDMLVSGGRTYCDPNAAQANYPYWTTPTYESYEQRAGTFACSNDCKDLTVKTKLSPSQALAARKSSSAKLQVQVEYTGHDTLDDVTVELDLPGGVVHTKISVRPKKDAKDPIVINGGQRLMWTGLSFKSKGKLTFIIEVNTAAANCPLTFSGAAYTTVNGVRSCDAYYSVTATKKAKNTRSSIRTKNSTHTKN